jgi:hypothetical protein
VYRFTIDLPAPTAGISVLRSVNVKRLSSGYLLYGPETVLDGA